MSLSNEIKEKISFEVIRVLVSRFESFPDDVSKNRNAPFHEAFLKAFVDKLENKVKDVPFFISLSSWLHGLNTTLGQTFFENVAHILSNGEKREYTSKRLGNLQIHKDQKEKINFLITELSNTISKPNMNQEDVSLIIEDISDKVNALDFSADVFIEDDKTITAIEMKSVRPNSGEMKTEKQKVLEGKAALKMIFPDKKIKFFMGFPFDPTSPPQNPTDYNKERFMSSNINMSKYFDKDEILLASELWDFLSGEKDTMEEILKIINVIATKELFGLYHFLCNNQNKANEKIKFTQILENWFLTSELELIENDETIKKKIANARKLKITYNQLMFNKGGYNIGRYHILKEIYKSPNKLNLQ